MYHNLTNPIMDYRAINERRQRINDEYKQMHAQRKRVEAYEAQQRLDMESQFEREQELLKLKS